MKPHLTDGSSDRGDEPVGPRARRVRSGIATLSELVAIGIEVDGAAALTGAATWVIYGRTTYDGELILAEYDDADEASAVLRSMPDRAFDDSRWTSSAGASVATTAPTRHGPEHHEEESP